MGRTATKRGRQRLFGTSSDQERVQSNDTAEPPSTELRDTTAADLESTTLAAETTATVDPTTLAAETTASRDATSTEEAAEAAAGRSKMQKTDRNKDDPLLRFRTVGTAASWKSSAPTYLLMFDENGVVHSNSLLPFSGVVRRTNKI